MNNYLNDTTSLRCSVVIPTYKRLQALQECLDSILVQSELPSEILVIDDDSTDAFFLQTYEKLFQKNHVEFRYVKKDHKREPKGTSTSRNLGMELALNEIVFILDDDLVLDAQFIERIMQVWKEEETSQLIGVGGVISNNRTISKLEQVYNHLFGFGSRYAWDVTDVGFQVWNDGVKKQEKGFYAHGGACSYHKLFVKEIGGFAVLNTGRVDLEDVEFALRAKRKGFHYIVEPNAKTEHQHASGGRPSVYLIGWQASQNRQIIFHTLCPQDFSHRIWFRWSVIGWILRQVLVGHMKRAFGMLIGSLKKAV